MDLDFAWVALERAALWVASTEIEHDETPRTAAAVTCTLVLPVQASHLRAVAACGRADIDNVPTAMAGARAVFELGLRTAWVYEPDGVAERELRAMALHTSAAVWKDKVGNRLEATTGADGSRWHRAAEVQRRIVDRNLPAGLGPDDIPRIPSTYEQLRALGLERLYHGYQLASEYVHGGLSSGGEMGAIRAEGSPFGVFWPQDWSLALNMSAWGTLFVSQHTHPKTNLVPPPLSELMAAANALLGAPGPDVSPQ